MSAMRGMGAKMAELGDTGLNAQHGISGAAYYNDYASERFRPYFECLCGFETIGCENWEEAGAEFDDHLKASRDEPEAPDPRFGRDPR